MAALSSISGAQLALVLALSNAFVLCKVSTETPNDSLPEPRDASVPAPAPKPRISPSPEAHGEAPAPPPTAATPSEPNAIAPSPESAVAMTRGQADLDPSNDHLVAPPDAIENCSEKLARLGFDFSRGELPFREGKPGFPRCGSFDAAILKRTKSGIAIRPPALVSCRLALAIADLDELFQELAEKYFHEKIVRLDQAGTYSCRKMQRFDLVSEHSYGNAIDILSFTLKSGRKITVLKDFGDLDKPPATQAALFLRDVGEQAFDRNAVSVSLGPYWDALHKDHFHVDLAHYRVDGSRPR